MFVKAIQELTEHDFVGATIVLDPSGTLTLRVRREPAFIWSVRKNRGEASIAFVLRPTGERYFRDDLDSLACELSGKAFLGIGPNGQLVFEGGIEAQPTAHLEPPDPLDNSTDIIRYASDVAIPGLGEFRTQRPD